MFSQKEVQDIGVLLYKQR